MNLNKAFVLGNITRDPEIRSMPNGGQVTNFSIATNRRYTLQSGEKKEEVEFHNIVTFGKLADIAARYLTKGSLVLIEGRIKTRNWQDTAGVKHYKTEIIAETMQMGPKGTGAPAGGNPNYPLRSEASQKSSFQRSPEPDGQDLPAQAGEIPVIQEDYTPPADDGSTDAKTVSFEDDSADEIDVKDIPF